MAFMVGGRLISAEGMMVVMFSQKLSVCCCGFLHVWLISPVEPFFILQHGFSLPELTSCLRDIMLNCAIASTKKPPQDKIMKFSRNDRQGRISHFLTIRLWTQTDCSTGGQSCSKMDTKTG
jgi:hypothetical protein